MDLLITVSNSQSANILKPLLRACIRRECSWQVFLTHEGVQVLQNSDVTQILETHKQKAVVCHDSWKRHCQNMPCPIALGSQTNHSEMAACATRVVSL